jgi:predicted nuclease of predicted toxin-antitoxin system
MKVLLDKCIPRKFKRGLPGHECQTVPEAGFAGKTNGELILIAEERGFEILLTVDKGLAHQPNVAGRRIAIIIVRAKSNRLAGLLPYAGACVAHISSMRPGQIVRIGE